MPPASTMGLPILALALAALTVVQAQELNVNCFWLSGSKYCGQWGEYSIPPASDGHYNDLASFDSYMATQVDSEQGGQKSFASAYGCPGWAGIGLRYHITSLCGYYVGIASIADKNGAQCNQNVGTTTCTSSAQGFVASLNALFANSAICTPQGSASPEQQAFRTSTAENFVNFAANLPGSDAPGCIAANTDVAMETSNCGFGDSAFALTFCKGQQKPDACCQQVAGFAATSTTASSSKTASSASSTSAVASSTTVTPPPLSSTSTTAVAPPPTTTADANGAAANSASTSTATSSASSTILGLSLPIFVGAAVGGTAFLIALIVALIMCARKGRKRRVAEAAGEKQGGMMEQHRGEDGMIAGGYQVGEAPYGQQQQQHGPQSAGGPQSGRGDYNMPLPMMMDERNGGHGNDLGNGSGEMSAGVSAMAAIAAGNASLLAAKPGTVDQSAETMEVVFNYVPNLSDEIYLYVGDPVVVKCKFDDGWGYGFNMTTNREGSFPLACVAPYTGEARAAPPPAAEASVSDGYRPSRASEDPNRASFTIRQRQSSMFGPPPGFRETMASSM
ncbi:hypothetical protein HK101_003555 [Irineochytrium annulatum]|nr:hypothetical protein HK101_003555 [Irineochytrium annulatum]